MATKSLFALMLLAAGCTAAEPLRFVSATADYSKPGAPVELKYALAKAPSAGTPVTVALQFHQTAAVESIKTKVSVSDGVQLRKSLQIAQLQQKPSAKIEDQVEIVTTTEGTHYINVFVETVVGGNLYGRAFAIPVVVGDAKANQKPKAPVKTDAKGNPIVELPAENR